MTTAPMTLTASRQPWLCSPLWDGSLILAPALVSSALAIACRPLFQDSHDLPLWTWVFLVLLVDVAHVYATLFRTYLEPIALRRHGALLIAIPLACWVVGALLYSIDALFFWRALAYLAVFHFIRQQYGFVMLYSRSETVLFAKSKLLDALCVYAVTIYPLIYWHTHLPRNFSWFVEGDFLPLAPGVLDQAAVTLYGIIVVTYIAKELAMFFSGGTFNIPKNLLIFGTAVSWWIGIVLFNSDMAFTMTNVLSHGIPYMALVWLYQRRSSKSFQPHESHETHETHEIRDKDRNGQSAIPKSIGYYAGVISRAALQCAPLFILLLWCLAYLEEGFWDGLVWREHLSFFSLFQRLPTITDASVLAILVPFLALPQSTHYVLDGFIWRVHPQSKDKKSIWSA